MACTQNIEIGLSGTGLTRGSELAALDGLIADADDSFRKTPRPIMEARLHFSRSQGLYQPQVPGPPLTVLLSISLVIHPP